MVEKLTGLAKDYFVFATSVRIFFSKGTFNYTEHLRNADIIKDHESEIRGYFERNKHLKGLDVKGFLGKKSDKKRAVLELILREGAGKAIGIALENKLFEDRGAFSSSRKRANEKYGSANGIGIYDIARKKED